MSQENVQVVRRIYDTWTQESPTFYDLFDEQVELRLNVMMGPYLGRRGVRPFVADLMADWTDLSMNVEELLDSGDQVVAVVREEGIGLSSQIPITSIETHVWTVRDGRAFRAHAYPSRAKALEAVGLRE